MKEEITGTYEVEYGDGYKLYILARDFGDAEVLFRKTGFGGEYPKIIGIKLIGRGISKDSFLLTPLHP